MILLVSVSARMLAELATREGYDVCAVDRFGDLDLQRLCPSVSLMRDFGGRGGMEEMVEVAEPIRADSVVYGAGLENRPDLVERLAAGRTLLGCSPETLRRVRDPAVLGASLRAAGFAYPRTLSAEEAPERAERTRRWLRKPIRGGGGRGVREWRGGRPRGDVIVQERIAGLPCSAAAVADGRSAVLLGVSEQLIGRRALGARGWRWCGNVVPPRLPATRAGRAGGGRGGDLRPPGRRVRPARRVRGGPGLGRRAAVGGRGQPAPGRVARDDRRRARRPLVRGASGGVRRAAARGAVRAARGAAGKAVLFATEDLRVPDTSDWTARGIRDVPHPGEAIAAGRPICTLVATGPDPEAVLAELEARAAALRAELHEVGVGA